MITNHELTVFTCLLLDKINSTGEKFEIMIILNTIEVKVFKLIKSSFIQAPLQNETKIDKKQNNVSTLF